MATEGAALVENRAGITFGVELYVPWDAPEAVVDICSEGVVPLRSIPDVIGLAEISAVYGFWFRIRGVWIRTFTM